MPSIGDDYLDFVDLDSRDPLGDSEGFVVMDSNAEGMAYQKRVLRFVAVSGPIDGQVLTGMWQVIVKDGPTGAEIFRQKVTLRLLVVGGFDFGVTFIPLDNGGKFETITVNGQSVPINASTGLREGWRYVDQPIVTPFVEFGTPVFKPNSGGILGGIFVDIDWTSPRYKMTLDDGAVFRVEDDQWRDGRDIPIAWFKTSIKPGAALVDAFIDPYGEMWHASTSEGTTRISSAFGPYRDLRANGFISDIKEASINGDRQGRKWLLAKEAAGWFEWSSADGGHNWTRGSQLWDNTAKMARMLITESGDRISMALDGNDVVVKNTGASETSATLVATVQKRQPFTPVIDAQGRIYAVGEDGAQYVTDSGGTGGWD